MLLFPFIIFLYNLFSLLALSVSLFTAFTKNSDLELNCVINVRVTYTERCDTVSIPMLNITYNPSDILYTYCITRILKRKCVKIFIKKDLCKLSLCSYVQGSGAVGGITVPVMLTGYDDTVLLRYRTYCGTVTILKQECIKIFFSKDSCKTSQCNVPKGSGAGWRITVRITCTWYGAPVLLWYGTHCCIVTPLKLECLKICYKIHLGKNFKWTDSQGSGAGMRITVPAPVKRSLYCVSALKTAQKRIGVINTKCKTLFCNAPCGRVIWARNLNLNTIRNLGAIDQSTISSLPKGTVTKTKDGTLYGKKYGGSVKRFIVSGNMLHIVNCVIKNSSYGDCLSPNSKKRYSKSVFCYGYGGYLSFL